MVSIVNYGVGNLRSVQNMFRRIGTKSEIVDDPGILGRSEKLVLPGVGHFKYGMEQLRKSGLVDILNERVISAKIPILGICLGAQMLGRMSEEGDVTGLGWIPMDTRAIDSGRLPTSARLPHMGWADTEVAGDCALFEGVSEIPRYYYVHSYHMVCDSKDVEISHVEFGYRFVSGVAKDNIVGVQFHPEKSHRHGMAVLKNFAERF
jgi:glutamine amidotransferase